MPVSVQNSLRGALYSIAIAASVPAFAGTTGVFLPPAPSGPGGEDSIETGSGARCRQSINSNGAYLDMGLTGTAASPVDSAGAFAYSDGRDREGVGYVRITIPLGKRPQRLDCSRLYEIELQRLQREIELLRLGVK